MKYNFCTLFDSYYLTRGIALYNSLELYCEDFHLYIFCFDDKSYTILQKLNLCHSTLISLKEFENENLTRVKPTRTIAEYCWTCTASTIWYSIKKFHLDHCTYLDADMQFFSSPGPIFEEIGTNSIGITPHNFSPRLKSSEIYGKYCVQFTYFKNDTEGLKALEWWRNSCIEWCYAKLEDGKYGDQKYLDYFESKFTNVCVITQIGAGLAPWNIANFYLELNTNIVTLSVLKDLRKRSLIFYHFQGLSFEERSGAVIAIPSILKIPKQGLKYIYEPYINALILIKNQIEGNSTNQKKIVFKKNIIKSLWTYFRINLKNYRIIRFIYYQLNKSRYNKPKKIGSLIK